MTERQLAWSHVLPTASLQELQATKMKFYPSVYKTLLHLIDFNFCENKPSFRRSGVQLFHQTIKITPSNFPQISFLNLEANWYAIKIPYLRFHQWHWALEISLIQRQVEIRCTEQVFRIFENRMFAKMKKRIMMTVYMRKYLRYCQKTGRCYNIYHAQNINSHLTKFLLLYWDGKDTALISDFLKIVYATQALRNVFFFEVGQSTDLMHYLIYQARKSKYDMWGFLSDNPMFEEFPACPVLGCFLLGHDVRMKILLRYGFQRIPTKSVISFYLNGELSPLYEKYDVTETLRKIGVFVRLPDPCWKIYILHRAFLVIEMLYIFGSINLSPEVQYTLNWTKCAELLWRSIPDPYISAEEMKMTLQFLETSDTRRDYNELCKKYRETFYEVSDLITMPRSLEHLCRCVIRHRLRQNFALPDGINFLHLPRTLKAFLRLES